MERKQNSKSKGGTSSGAKSVKKDKGQASGGAIKKTVAPSISSNDSGAGPTRNQRKPKVRPSSDPKDPQQEIKKESYRSVQQNQNSVPQGAPHRPKSNNGIPTVSPRSIKSPECPRPNSATPKYVTKTPISAKKSFQNRAPQKTPKFEPYIPLFRVQQGLKRGEFIEGALRINPRNYEDAYINAPDGLMDIYIGGIQNRNKAFNGDIVAVQVNPKQEWRVLCDSIRDHQERHGTLFVRELYSPASTPCKLHTPEKSRLPSRASSAWNESAKTRLPDSLHIMGVDKLTEQLDEMSIQSKKKNRSKRHRMRNRSKSATSSKDQSSATSHSQGSSEDILSKMSADNSPVRQSAAKNSGDDEHIYDGTKVDNASMNGHCVNQWANEIPSGQIASSDNINDLQSHPVDDPWEAQDNSLSILTSPDVLLDFGRDNPLQVLCDELQQKRNDASDEDEESCHLGVVVAPDDLSGDEFTDSASTRSSPTHQLERELEDSEFFASQQDSENNNNNILSSCDHGTLQYVTVSESAGMVSRTVHNTEKSIKNMDCRAEVNDLEGVLLNSVNSEVIVNSDVCNVGYESSSVEQALFNPDEIMLVRTAPVENPSDSSKSKRKRKKTRRSKNRQKPEQSIPENASAEESMPIESLTVEEVMKHLLWPKFVQRTGKVVQILERKHSCTAVGHIKLLQDRNPRFALFSPKDSRLPRFMVPMSDCPQGFYYRPQDFDKFLYLGSIKQWEDHMFAQGRLIRNLGEVKQIEAQTIGLLYEHDVDFTEFSHEVLSCLPPANSWTVPEDEVQSRLDCRKECIFTIDPSTARDMDDAMSCELLPNGNLQIGVHIADVTYFVQEGTPLDECARKRATSVYMVQQVIPMLPRILCDDLCSLTPGQDRLAFSVFWEMTQECEIISHRFERCLINSCIKLSYEHAQDMIENPNRKWTSDEHPPLYGQFAITDVIRRVVILNQLAVKLRQRRFTDGALQLNQVKLQFNLCKDTGYPLGFSVYVQKDSNRMIEEFMLLANMTVAAQIYKAFPKLALLRRHPPPSCKPMEDVVSMCANMGIHLDSKTSGALQASLYRYFAEDELSVARNLVLTHLCSKPMNCALYFCTGELDNPEDFHHYALSVPLYTHYTSPIRRYPDIIVHRLLAASLDMGSPPKLEIRQMGKIASHCNDKKYFAKRVSESSDELFLAVFVMKCGPLPAKAMVINVMDHSFDCLVLHYGIVKRVYCDRLPVNQQRYQKVNGVPTLSLRWQDNSLQTIIMFALVDVILTTNDELQILLALKVPFA